MIMALWLIGFLKNVLHCYGQILSLPTVQTKCWYIFFDFLFYSDDEKEVKGHHIGADGNTESSHIRRNLMDMLGLAVPRTISTATQTVHGIRRSASTQTDGFHSDNDQSNERE